MRVKEGDVAIDFKTRSVFNEAVSLSEYKGKMMLLSFYRYASCPLCNLRIHHLIDKYDSFHKKGLSMLAFFESPRESILKYVSRHDAPFPIIADPEMRIYNDYGVESSWSGFFKGMLNFSSMMNALKKGYLPGKLEGNKALIPADFLIGPDQQVIRAYYGKDIGDHLPIKEIETWLEDEEITPSLKR